MSLWRKRGTSDTIAPFARHNGQNTPKLFTMTAMTDNDLSIKSEDLSIKSWVGLTEDERYKLWLTTPAETENRFAFAEAIEAKLKEKNT